VLFLPGRSAAEGIKISDPRKSGGDARLDTLCMLCRDSSFTFSIFLVFFNRLENSSYKIHSGKEYNYFLAKKLSKFTKHIAYIIK